MLTKLVIAFSILALAAAFAGTIPAKAPASQVTLSEPAVINGTALKAGDYRLIVNPGKVTFVMNKEPREIAATVETGDKKYYQNEVQYEHAGNQTTIKQICLGGTKIRVVFN
jgi:Protein of unknown function (DUF2911)